MATAHRKGRLKKRTFQADSDYKKACADIDTKRMVKLIKRSSTQPVKKRQKPQKRIPKGCPKRKSKWEYTFHAAWNIKSIERIVDLAIFEKLTLKELALFIFMVSYAWGSTHGTRSRNPYKLGRATTAEIFGVDVDTVSTWFENLSKLGLIRRKYIVKLRGTNERVSFPTKDQAFNFKNENHGNMTGTEVYIRERDFCVFKKSKAVTRTDVVYRGRKTKTGLPS